MQVIEIIKNLSTPTTAIVTTLTDVKMNKKDVETKSRLNPYLGAQKKCVMKVELASNYENAVNEQRKIEEKTADFQSSSRTWGQSLGNGIVENNNKIYVGFIVKDVISTEYFVDDSAIDKKELDAFIPKKQSSSQGVDTEVIYRTVAIENILKLELV
jgi:hypothetical protein